MSQYRHIGLYLLLSGILCSCVGREILPETSVEGGNIPLQIQGNITQVYTTRAADSGFADGDQIGVYIVNYENGEAGALSVNGNHATNVRHTYVASEGKWVPSYTIYWKDREMLVDAYSYYPYIDDVTSVSALPFVVQRNQSVSLENSKMSAYEASDFLWAKASGVSPAMQTITLNHNHLMAGVQVTLVADEGFSASEWATAEKIVLIENTVLKGHIDMGTGTVTPDKGSEKSPVVPSYNNGEWRAVVIPQAVEAGETLLSITVDGYSYQFTREDLMTYHPGKLHKFTIRVKKSIETGDYTFTVLDEAITVWETETLSHSGSVREYVVVHVSEAGKLEEAIAAKGLVPENIVNLKVCGEMTESDFWYIHSHIPNLESVNLYDCKLRQCHFADYDETLEDDVLPRDAFEGMVYLKTCVFPKVLRKIGQDAFGITQLSGSLIIPEGVTHIGRGAFERRGYSQEIANHLYGTLSLPSTLEYIGESAFNGCLFTGELQLPDNLTVIGNYAFHGCSRLTGMLVLPEKLTGLGLEVFSGTPGLTGVIRIPDSLTTIGSRAFEGSGITGVIFPEGIEHISDYAFNSTALEGELILPQSLKTMGSYAFGGTKITSISFPPDVDIIPQGAFNSCRHLRDTLYLPPNLVQLGPWAFLDCSQLEAVVFPKTVTRLDDGSFRGCYSIGYVHLDAMEPPRLHSLNVFDGVAKDNFTIEVPADAVDAYRSADYWREFKRISAYRGFVSRPSFANVLNAGGTRELVLNAPAYTEWNVVSCPEWCHLSASSGIGKTKLTLTIDPMPHGSQDRLNKIVLQLAAEQECLTYIDIGQYDYDYDEDEHLVLQQATKGNGIDVFIVGDGYDAIDISSGLYLDDMRQEMEYFFAVEPYKTYREYFNFHTAFALSYESGIGTVNTLRNVKFGTSYGNGTWESRLSGNGADVVKYAVENVESITDANVNRLTAILIPNAEAYDGICQMWTNGTSVAFCPKSTALYPNDARGILQHEACGHGFGKLADEYIYHKAFIQTCTCSCCPHVDEFLVAKDWGWYSNVSINGKFKTVEWSHLIYDERYNDIVDIYEGAYYHSRGIYRSEYNSCMNNNVPYFSTISRQNIVERIMEYAGEEFSFEKFVEHDSREWGIDFTDPTQTKGVVWQDPYIMRPDHAPIIIEGSPLD